MNKIIRFIELMLAKSILVSVMSFITILPIINVIFIDYFWGRDDDRKIMKNLFFDKWY
ncbi:MAG: hypothetical protein ACOCP8_09195 [archaeon]